MEIKLHSNKKHRVISYYLELIKSLIKSKRTPFKILYFADLFCGDGKCIIKETKVEYEPPIISLLKSAKKEGFKLNCFLNDIEPKNIELIKKNTKDYAEFIRDNYTIGDANEYYKKVLSKIPKDQFSIFYLDPFKHWQLRWKTIEEISKHTHNYLYKGKSFVRRPELIINLMTYTMVRNYDKPYAKQGITESLGTDEWLKQIDLNKSKGISSPIENAFLEIFIKQLEKLGYKVLYVKIEQTTPPENTVYYLIWALNEQGYELVKNKMINYMKKLAEIAQAENKGELAKVRAREKGDTDLKDFFKSS